MRVSLSVVTAGITLISSTSSSPIVELKNGSYVGTYSSQYDQDYFLGIPYSQPPVGDLRFRPPRSLNNTWTETRNATEYQPECYGYGRDTWSLGNIVSEDCLTLNVIRPANASNDLPVAVWIHGGNYTMGGNSDLRYNLSFIVQQSVYARAPVIAISINYRLQAFGFLFSKEILEDGAGNLGFRDQRLALHWIQENIAAFGGDASKVTIWGESAGGGSVGAQLVAYGGRDDKLFRGAIAQSGAPTGFTRYLNNQTAAPAYNAIVNATNCTGASNTLACLRKVPINTLNAVLNSSVTATAQFGSQIDGDFLRESPTTQLFNGDFVKVPILIGANHDEGTAFGAQGINTTAQFLTNIRLYGVDNTTANSFLALYPDIPAIGIPGTFVGRPFGTIGSMAKRSFAFGGDLLMHAPRRLQSQAWAKYNVTSYSYVFNVIVAGLPNTVGATHFQEVAFVMHNLQGNGYPPNGNPNPFEGKPQSYQDLSTLMSRMWISFIVDGDPNNSGVSCIKWPKYESGTSSNIVFDANVTALAYLEEDTYRAEGIQYMIEHMVDQFGR